MKRQAELVIYILSAILLPLLLYHTWKGTFTVGETLGSITGAVCVWLCVKEHIWNWPIGLISSTAYIFVFYDARLYADTMLQCMYIVLGILGWYWWLHGGKEKTRLKVSPMDIRTGAVLCLFVVVGTWAWMIHLERINDSAPFLDAFTSITSIAAQYLITKKHIENWHVWIVVDVIYVYLYIVRHLYLTGALYFLYTIMAVAGLVAWRESMRLSAQQTAI